MMFGKHELKKEKKDYCLGTYNIELKAAIAYNIKAKELYGEFANLNKISEEDFNLYKDEVISNLKRLKQLDDNYTC